MKNAAREDGKESASSHSNAVEPQGWPDEEQSEINPMDLTDISDDEYIEITNFVIGSGQH